MSAPATPDDPFVLDIVSVTFGSRDFTAFTTDKFNEALSQNPGVKTWSFDASTDFFQPDPNQKVVKACVVVYRNTFPNPDGSVSWSNFKSIAVDESHPAVTLVFDGVGDTAWISPQPPASGQYIVAAYWYKVDVTKGVRDQYAKQGFVAGTGVSIVVDSDALEVQDPSPGAFKQCSITYGNWVYPGQWMFHVAVDLQSAATWDLTIPVVFPPMAPTQSHISATYVKFSNLNNVLGLYPQIYAANGGNLIWDGRNSGYLIAYAKTTNAIELVQFAGCQEREPYFLAFAARDGSNVWGNAIDTVYATSSSAGTPITCSSKMSQNAAQITFDETNVGPPTYRNRDLRLNIYAATWGNKDYTDFVRQQYVSNTIANPPTDISNSWSLAANLARFGKDPDQWTHKSCVIIFRVAYLIGTTPGKIGNPKDPPPGDQSYNADTVREVFTDEYPVLEDISAFQVAGAIENGNITIDLLKQDLTPMVWPSPITINKTQVYTPFIAKAVWVNLDVTKFVQDAVTTTWTQAGPSVTSVPVSVAGIGGGEDPWPANPLKALTVLVGYNIQNQAGNYQWSVLYARKLDSSSASWNMLIPATPATPQAQWPLTVTPFRLPACNSVTFKNTTSLTCWPQIVIDGGQVVWDGKAQANSDNWKIATGQDKSLRLIDDCKLVQGNPYSLTFRCDSETWIPFTGWIVASGSTPQYAATLTYLPDPNLSASGKYQVLRENALVVQ